MALRLPSLQSKGRRRLAQARIGVDVTDNVIGSVDQYAGMVGVICGAFTPVHGCVDPGLQEVAAEKL